jgi:excisionase family DNA binding protein
VGVCFFKKKKFGEVILYRWSEFWGFQTLQSFASIDASDLDEVERMTLKLLRVGEVAQLLRCGQSTVWRLAKNGEIAQPLKIGGMTRWDEVQLLQNIHHRGAAAASTQATSIPDEGAVAPTRSKRQVRVRPKPARGGNK